LGNSGSAITQKEVIGDRKSPLNYVVKPHVQGDEECV